MTYCVQFTDKEALTTLRGGLDMNSFFWRDVQNKDPTTYDALLEMIRCEILNEELKDHMNRASQGLLSPQMRRGRGPTSHLMDNQAPNESWTGTCCCDTQCSTYARLRRSQPER